MKILSGLMPSVQSGFGVSRCLCRLPLLVALIGGITGAEVALAYDVCSDGGTGPASEDTSCVHEDMGGYGIDVHVENYDASEYGHLGSHRDAIRHGAGHEDEVDHIYGETGNTVTVGHFWDPDPDGVFNPLNQNTLDGGAFFSGTLGNSWQKAQAYWSRALGEYVARNFTKTSGAYHYLGHVVHHVGDNTIPTHVSVISHGPYNRDSFENWMSNKFHVLCPGAAGCELGDLDTRVEFSPPTYNHRPKGTELTELIYDHQPKLGRIDPLKYADLNFDIPEVSGVETPDDKLLWLLYTTNQIAEFFAADRNNAFNSDGEGEANDPTGWAQADLNLMTAANLRPTTVDQMSDDDSCDCDAEPEKDLSSIREYSYLRGIRALGGLYNLFQQTVETKPILSVEITAVDVMMPNGTCNDGLISDTCDFYSKVQFSDVTASPTPIMFAVISGQNDGDQTEDDNYITPNWRWGHAVENSGFVRIRVQIFDDDDFPVQDDVPVRITPYLPDSDTSGTSLDMVVDLSKCLRGEAGAITVTNVLGTALSGQISSSICGQSISTLVTGEEDEDDGIARVKFTVKIDESIPPVISCDAPDGEWHANDVSIACTATDEGSGLANPDDASFLLWTNIPPGTETADAMTNSREVCDQSGNCATAGPIGGNKVDKKAPEITIVEPTATQYVHSATLVLNYSVTDGGSDVATVTATMNGNTTVAGHGLDSGQAINLLTALPLGEHIFAIDAEDNVGNQSPTESVTFEIIVTTQSIIDAVSQLAATRDVHQNMVNPLLAKLNNAKRKMDALECTPARNMYEAFINQLQAQNGGKVSSIAAEILIGDAQYLIANCGIVATEENAGDEPATADSNQSNQNQGSSATTPTSTASASNTVKQTPSGGGGSLSIAMCVVLLAAMSINRRRRRIVLAD